MISVTRFDNTEVVINADLIEFIETLPDTHITLVTGKKLLVRENAEEIVTRILAFRRAAGPPLCRPVTGEYSPERKLDED